MAAQVVVDGEDVLSIYKKAFIVKIPLQSIVDFEFCECFDLFKKGTNIVGVTKCSVFDGSIMRAKIGGFSSSRGVLKCTK